MRIAIIYLSAIIIAELATVLIQPVWGIILYILTLIWLILHPAIDIRYPHRPLILSLSLVPLLRIISLSMPLTNIPQIWWYPIISTPLLIAVVVVMRTLNYRAADVGLALKRLPIQLIVAMTGILLGIVEYSILKPEAMVTELTWQAVWIPALVLLIFTGFAEELIFRGVLQYSAVRAFKGWGIVYISLLFAILHTGFLSWQDVAFVFFVALFFGWIVKQTGSLLGVTLAHGLTNIVLFLLAPFFF